MLLRPLAARRPDVDSLAFVPVGRAGLRDFIAGYVEPGLSKFVVRPLAPVTSWAEEARWLATRSSTCTPDSGRRQNNRAPSPDHLRHRPNLTRASAGQRPGLKALRPSGTSRNVLVRNERLDLLNHGGPPVPRRLRDGATLLARPAQEDLRG